MEGKAIARHLRVAPRKMRQVIDLVKGKDADEAINILHFTRKGAAKQVETTIRSAVANLTFENPSIKIEDLFIKEIFVDGGPVIKRVRPASMGRRYLIRKRTSHLTVVVADRS